MSRLVASFFVIASISSADATCIAAAMPGLAHCHTCPSQQGSQCVDQGRWLTCYSTYEACCNDWEVKNKQSNTAQCVADSEAADNEEVEDPNENLPDVEEYCKKVVTLDTTQTNAQCMESCQDILGGGKKPEDDESWSRTCAYSHWYAVNGRTVVDGDCFEKWIYGYSQEVNLASIDVNLITDTPAQCQLHCQMNDECVNWAWVSDLYGPTGSEKVGRCLLKNRKMVEMALSISTAVLNPPNMNAQYCNIGMPHQCLYGGYRCMPCDGGEQRCVWETDMHVTGWKYCVPTDTCSPFEIVATTPYPTQAPTTPTPTEAATKAPTPEPTKAPTPEPTEAPTKAPTPEPTEAPTKAPTPEPTEAPTQAPTPEPTEVPTPEPSKAPTPETTEAPSKAPTPEPTEAPTKAPTPEPTEAPTKAPTPEPTKAPTPEPTEAPTPEPTEAPTKAPTPEPTQAPTPEPTGAPTKAPTPEPTEAPTKGPVATEIPQGSEEVAEPTRSPVGTSTDAIVRSTTSIPPKETTTGILLDQTTMEGAGPECPGDERTTAAESGNGECSNKRPPPCNEHCECRGRPHCGCCERGQLYIRVSDRPKKLHFELEN